MKPLLIFIISSVFLSCNPENSAKEVPDQISLESKKVIDPINEIDGTDVPEKRFIGLPLSEFYKENKDQIKEVTWDAEPPGKLASAYFTLDDNRYYVIDLSDIPGKYSFNEFHKWELSQVGSSKIDNITLMKRGGIVVRSTSKQNKF